MMCLYALLSGRIFARKGMIYEKVRKVWNMHRGDDLALCFDECD